MEYTTSKGLSFILLRISFEYFGAYFSKHLIFSAVYFYVFDLWLQNWNTWIQLLTYVPQGLDYKNELNVKINMTVPENLKN